MILLFGVGVASVSSLAPDALAAGKTATSSPGLSQAVIQKTVRAKFDELQKCYDDLDDQPPLRVEMHFVVGPDGKVKAGYVESVVRPAMAPCVERTMFALTFPRPAGGDVSVVYSVDFKP
ncbi:AgmX/PglI C-terminal domain-containing protein [Pendulispora albinea]|uniref:AgmX/PglI C-terminal domain-containing protein n=1 Tax=Pendulispora albinea TaxID=2741071 RepID=A0ABZ2MBI4_9BACT